MAPQPKTDIVFAISTDTFGGAEQYLLELIKSLTSAGLACAVVGRFRYELPAGVTYYEIPLAPKWGSRNIVSSAFKASSELKRYRRVIDALQPKLLHAQFKREQVLLTPHYASKIPVHWTEHGVFPDGAYGRILKFVYRTGAKRVQSIVCVSEAVAQSLTQTVKIPKHLISVVENSVDLTRFSPSPDTRIQLRDSYGIPQDAILIIQAGRLERAKGMDRGIAALRLMPSNHYMIILGEGPYESLLRDMGAHVQDRLTFTGFVDNVEDFLAASDCFLLLSRPAAREGIPLTLLQACATGLPCIIASDSGISFQPKESFAGAREADNPSNVAEAIQIALQNAERYSQQSLALANSHSHEEWTKTMLHHFFGNDFHSKSQGTPG